MKRFSGQVAECLVLAQQCSVYMHEQNHHAGLSQLKKLSSQLVEISEKMTLHQSDFKEVGFDVDLNYYGQILVGILQAQDNTDYILIADLLELQLVPFLYQVQESLLALNVLLTDDTYFERNLLVLEKKDKKLANLIRTCEDSNNIVVEPTSSGYLTMLMRDNSGEYYFHSNVNPVIAAEHFAKQYYNSEEDCYTILGLGLSYHILALLQLDDGIYLNIIEPDLEVIKCACEAMDLTALFGNDHVTLYYDPEFIHLKERLHNSGNLIIHQPSLRHIQNEKIRLAIDKFFIRDSGIRNFGRLFHINFRDNIKSCDGYMDDLEIDFSGKNAVIVAAGPSLDRNVEQLRNRPENTLIIAVGTVFRKMIQMGIRPDYVVFLDAQKHMYQQIEGLENENVPIIVASSACKEIALNYNGPKYLICQNGYNKAEEYAKSKGYRTYETGGSVSTIALDICLQLKCSQIAFIGLDLAYTQGKSHATSTLDCSDVDTDGMIQVEGYYGEKVSATKLFIIYREWIEKRASKQDAIGRVIDATEGGALKKNLIKQNLKETFDAWK